ncbi:MAG: hypothetical protein JXA08_05820 [Methanomicrobiaceae archaeon]|nr:hypothetical protein [Methanomicrobiaceae archaeon]
MLLTEPPVPGGGTGTVFFFPEASVFIHVMTGIAVFRVPASVLRYEHNILHDSHCLQEVAGIFTPAGVLRYEFFGDDFVYLPESEYAGISGCIITHVHRSGYPFSSYDILESSRFMVHEMRVVTSTTLYSLKAGTGGWPDPIVTAALLRDVMQSGIYRWYAYHIRKQFRCSPGPCPSGAVCLMRETFLRLCAGALGLVFARGSWSECPRKYR